MTQLPLQEGIPRFKSNEDRIDKFVNGGPTESYVTSDGVGVPSIRNFLEQNFDIIESLPDTYVPKYRLNNLDGKNLNQQKQGFFHVEGPQPTDGSLLNTPDPKAFALTGIQSGDIARGMQIVVPYYNEDPGLNAMFWRRSGDGWNNQWRAVWDSENLPVTDFVKGALQAPNAAAFRSYIGAGSTGGGTAGVTTFKSRAGNVVPEAGDYNSSQIAHDAGSVADALQYLLRGVGSMLTPELFGAAGDGIADDTVAVQAMFNSAGNGTVLLINGRYKISSPVTVNGKALHFLGHNRGNSDRYTGFAFTGTGCLVLQDADYCKLENIKLRCLPGKANESYVFIADNSPNLVFQGVTIACENVAGSRGAAFRNGTNRFRAIDFTATGAQGDHLLYFGGTLHNGADIIEMHQFALGAGDNTDLMLFDGQSGSAKFTNFAMNFGRNAVVVQRGADNRASSFFYFAAGGWENGKRGPFRFLAGGNIQIVGCYIGSDSSAIANTHGIYLGPQVSDVRIIGCVIRAHGGHGIFIDGACGVVVEGCNITRNGTQSPNGYDGIRISSGSQDIMIVGNNIGEQTVWDADANGGAGARVTNSAIQRYGIGNGASTADIVIANNNLRGNTSGGIGGTQTTGPGIVNNLV